jgi:deazaflavin-dependent oxidoreductase (nitroreductase family)
VPGSNLKYRVVQPFEKRVVNPFVKLAWRLGLAPPGDALLETIGRRSGAPLRTPICDGLEGETFWLVAQHGRRVDYVKNIEANPRVRVRTASVREWRTGTAHIIDDDDPWDRLEVIAQSGFWRRVCIGTSRAMSTTPLTIRIELDSG